MNIEKEAIMHDNVENNTSVHGSPRWTLRLEGLMIFGASLFIYHHMAMGSWTLFLLLFFLPDMGLLGYLSNNVIGAVTYNITHTYVTPLCLGGMFYLLGVPEWHYVVVIWISHIGFDRALGFGLKYPSGFKNTHLGEIGKLGR